MAVQEETYNLDDPLHPWIWADIDSELDYSRNWAEWLVAGDSLLSITPVIQTPLLLGTQSPFISTTFTIIWVKVGPTAKANRQYSLTHRIVTAQGRKDDRTVWLKIRER